MLSFPEGLFQMSILSRRGLSMVRYILLAFDVVFVSLLLFVVLFSGWGEGGGYLFFCLLLIVFCCFLFCLFFVLYFGGIK